MFSVRHRTRFFLRYEPTTNQLIPIDKIHVKGANLMLRTTDEYHETTFFSV